MTGRRQPSRRGGAPTPRLAYLNSHYPALSHTFIEREIHALRGSGVDISTFSIRPCDPRDLLSEQMRRDHAETLVLLGGDAPLWVRAHAALLLRRPDVWFDTLRQALRSGAATPKAKLWQVFYFGESVVLANRMRAKGLRHVHVHHANVSADVARLAVRIGEHVDGPGSWSWSLTVHGSAEFELVEQWDVAAKLRQTAAVACISDFCRAQILRLIPTDHWDKVHVVHMSVDPEQFTPPARPRHHDGPLRIVCVGRLVALKGLPILIEALTALAAQGIHSETRIVGQGEMTEPLQQLIRAAGLQDEVRLVGPVGQDDIVDVYHWADVFIHPSFLEGLPVVLMEAMATELPVIATRIGAVSELVEDGVSGRVIPPARADLLAAAIAQIDADPALRARMGRAGRAAVLTGFVPAVTNPAMLEFLTAVLAGPDGR